MSQLCFHLVSLRFLLVALVPVLCVSFNTISVLINSKQQQISNKRCIVFNFFSTHIIISPLVSDIYQCSMSTETVTKDNLLLSNYQYLLFVEYSETGR